jgi:serine/threonine protein kinase/tetratricopeptide (TPR) repeat protein
VREAVPKTPQGYADRKPPSAAGAPRPKEAVEVDQPTKGLTAEEIRAASGSGSGAALERPTFLPSQIVAGRYEIVRFVASGAMGEVYEVEDTVLRGRLALKTIRPVIAADDRAVERFKREIALSRQITHPNVGRVFDIGIQQAGEGRGEVLFFTMELLVGESLAARITRRKRLPCVEALPILEQIAAGLGAAHAVGVIHRDLKSGNVMLVTPADPSRPERVAVTDFGLARSIGRSPDAASSISDSGVVVGSPAYMAPEQVEAKPLTPAADLYSLGIIAYELVTGVRPFDGGSAMTVATRRLTTPPPPPRSVVPDLDPTWDRAILKCLALAPADRFASAADFVRALREGAASEAPTRAALPTPRKPETPAPGPPSDRSFWARPSVVMVGLLALASLALASLVAVGVLPRRGAPGPTATPAAAATAAARRVVAVLEPRGVPGESETAWLQTAIAEALRADLASGGEVRVLPASEESLAALGGDSTVTGTCVVTGPGSPALLRLDLQLQDHAGGPPLVAASATGTENQVVDLVTRAAAPVRQALGLRGLTPAQSLQVEASLPRHPEALRRYAEGLGRLRRGEASEAAAALRAAAAVEPRHARTQAALSQAWQALGDDAKALDAARAAVALTESLGPEERLLFQARLHAAARDWARAAESYEALVTLHPDDLETRLQLAEVQVRGGHAREALVTLDAAGERERRDPRLALVKARAYMGLGDFPAMRAAARAAADEAQRHGANALLAQARLAESSALLSLGDARAASAAADEARRLFDASRDRNGSARALEAVALAAESGGDLGGARRLHERALAAHEALGDSLSAARALNNLGRLAMAQGQAEEAQRRYEAGLAIFRRLGAKSEAARVLVNLGAQLQNAGRLDAARARYMEALDLFSETGEKSGVALALTNLGEIAFIRGDLEESLRMHEESLATNREIGERSGQAYDLSRVGEVAAARGDLVVARGKLEEAIATYQDMADKLGRYSVQVGLARVLLEQGDAVHALRLARESEEVLRAEGVQDARAEALLVAAEASLAAGDARSARASVEEAGPLVTQGEDLVPRLEHAIAQARVRAAAGSPGETDAALAALAGVAAQAKAGGFVQVELRARLAAGRIEAEAGRPGPARAHLEAVAREARARGLGLIARKAVP